MQCENLPKCKKVITNAYSCNKCTGKFCSNTCMIDHYFDKHQAGDESTNSTIVLKGMSKTAEHLTAPMILTKKKSNNIESVFIKSGDFINEIKYDSYFDFKNFEKVKLGKKTHVLGSGAFGEVYLVKSKKDGKFFAVKQMEKQRILETGAKLDIVRREIDIHMRLIHPFIVRMHSYFEDETSFYLIMDYANSGTLFSAIRKSKGMDEKRAFKYFIQTAAAVHFIHENNLIHRDLKPENLLIDDKDNIKLCDFGWCIELEIGNRTTFCGTIEYMAPEIVREMPYDRSIDVWSLGILLYELLHGYSPFRAGNNNNEDEEYSQVFKNIIKYNFKIDRTDLSENCKDLITKLLTPQNNFRFKTKDIFSHPWILDFESAYETGKESTLSSISGNNSKNSTSGFKKEESKPKGHLRKISGVNNKGLNIPKSALKQDNKPIEPEEDKKTDIKKRSLKDNKLEEHREKIKENLHLQKLNSVKEAINSTQDFSLLSNGDRTDSLFDKVLTQVKERNKDKRKKSIIIEDQSEFDMDKILVAEKSNKIVLKISRDDRNKSVDLGKKATKAKKQDFQLLKDIKQIEINLNNHIKEENKKYDSLKNKKDKLKNELDLNKSEIKKTNTKAKLNSNKDYVQFDDILQTQGSYSNNNSKKTSVYSNKNSNAVSIHPKSYNKKVEVEEEKLTKTEKLESAITPIKSKSGLNKIKSPPLGSPSKTPSNKNKDNYNDLIYNAIIKKGRESNKNPKNSAGGKQPVKDLNKELDLSFLPKDMLYNNVSYDSSNNNILSAIEMLEKAQESKKEIDQEGKNRSLWEKFANFMNPFKCGQGSEN